MTQLAQTGFTLDKEAIVGIGVILTAVISLLNLRYSLRHNRRSSYENAVMAQRFKWIEDLRANLSRFVALIHQCSVAPPSDATERHKIFQEVAHLRMLIRLQLAPRVARLDELFEEKVEAIFRSGDALSQTEIDAQLAGLVMTGQDFLWVEWRKVKDELLYGDPYDTWSRRFKIWLERIDSQLNESEET